MSDQRDFRVRVWLSAVAATVIIAGLASRSAAVPLPGLVKTFAGDTLWAVLVFLLLAIAMPRRPVLCLAAAALGIAFSVELLQLYQAPWIGVVRDTLPGKLVLGRGFLFSDLLCYTLGIGLAAVAYQAVCERHARDFKTIAGVGTIITILVAITASNLGLGPQLFGFVYRIPGQDKTGHFLLMGALSFFAVLMFAPRSRRRRSNACALIIASLCLITGLEEGSQYFISTRSFSIADLLCSWAGIVVFGSVACRCLRRSPE